MIFPFLQIFHMNENHLDIWVHPKAIGSAQKIRTKRETKIPEEMLIEQTIRISDKFGFQASKQAPPKNGSNKIRTGSNQVR